MFVNESHMPQRLAPNLYTSPEHLEREMERMFEPGWHCIGALPDLPNDGDYFTRTLFGKPLICWKTGGEVHTFLNVCTHRFSMLRDQPCGHMGEHLKCQYHGWEYDCNGDTQKIPDAKSFRPMAKGELGLRKFRTETAGQLIFVTLNENATGLREFLGDYLYDMCDRWFSPDHDLACPIDIHHECNWKVVIENVLEGYHIGEVHPKSFGTYPNEECCRHEFHEFWDFYIDDYSTIPKNARPERIMSRIIGYEPDYRWQHLLRYPNVVFGKMAMFTWVQMVLPVSATECHAMWRIFCYPGQRGRLKSRILSKGLRFWGRRFMSRVIGEDEAIYPSIYKGIASPMRPRGGLISTREERIFPFQDYVLKMTEEEEFITKDREIEEERTQPTTATTDGG